MDNKEQAAYDNGYRTAKSYFDCVKERAWALEQAVRMVSVGADAKALIAYATELEKYVTASSPVSNKSARKSPKGK